MPYEASHGALRRVAVIGAGISGMGAAYHLSKTSRVTLFEAEKRLGGHARTIVAGKRGDQPVDTGFIVFNRVNYPHLCRLFSELDVPVAESNMSFASSIDGGRLEYALTSLNTLFAQRRNALNPRFLRMVNDILRFNRLAEELAGDEDMTIREFLALLKAGDWFRDYYLLPFSGAIWSTPTSGILIFLFLCLYLLLLHLLPPLPSPRLPSPRLPSHPPLLSLCFLLPYLLFILFSPSLPSIRLLQLLLLFLFSSSVISSFYFAFF